MWAAFAHVVVSYHRRPSPPTGLLHAVRRRDVLLSTAAALAACPNVCWAEAESATGAVATISLMSGDLRFRLSPDGAPAAVKLFTSLANSGYYDDSAIHAVHADSIVGGDPNSRLGYGPNDGLINAGYFYGKVRAWGSDESKVYGGAKTACPAGTATACTLAYRIPAEQPGREPNFGSLALALGGQPGMVVPSKRGTVGSQFEIYLGPKDTQYYPYGNSVPPVIGELVEGHELLRQIAALPVTNSYLTESKGRGMRGTPAFARPRDIPRERAAVLRVRVSSS